MAYICICYYTDMSFGRSSSSGENIVMVNQSEVVLVCLHLRKRKINMLRGHISLQILLMVSSHLKMDLYLQKIFGGILKTDEA